MKNDEKQTEARKAFRRMVWVTFCAVFFLVAVGGVVRVTGAGLGCPDWPTCWGCWLPPTSPEKIPSFTNEAGNKFYEDKQGNHHPISEFDSTMMWIEYLNRMVGVVVGLMIIATFILSLRLRKNDPRLFQGSLTALLLVLFQGWLGAVVVRSGLQPGIITLHMVLAMVLLCLLLWLARRASEEDENVDSAPAAPRYARILTGAVMLQVATGTQVREGIDPFIKDSKGLPREAWLGQVGLADDLHRPTSWLVLILVLLTWNGLRDMESPQRKLAHIAVGITLAQMTLGLILENAGLPPIAQTLHLAGAAALTCIAFCLGWPIGKVEKLSA